MFFESMWIADAPCPKLLLSIEETRRALGDVSRTTIYSLAAQGKIRIVKMGRRSFTVSAEVRAYVDSLPSLSGTGA